jgi:hypothetical protein
MHVRLRLDAAGWGALGRKHKRVSRVEAWEGEGPFVFYNVQLQDGALIFYEQGTARQRTVPPHQIRFNDGGEMVQLPVRRVRAWPGVLCPLVFLQQYLCNPVA